ncbi:hypothetical protein BDN72DRAFT_879578 [Pluteus cervinus]|uniref:Uncharacterized protein n=1 Tax=Pluteus cervinus TaxID=181527 RepID=A0ACD3APE3_9AGAR|nr:hypothetical protein BDN72DRAFT_879578 [Pluteus cervinus]
MSTGSQLDAECPLDMPSDRPNLSAHSLTQDVRFASSCVLLLVLSSWLMSPTHIYLILLCRPQPSFPPLSTSHLPQSPLFEIMSTNPTRNTGTSTPSTPSRSERALDVLKRFVTLKIAATSGVVVGQGTTSGDQDNVEGRVGQEWVYPFILQILSTSSISRTGLRSPPTRGLVRRVQKVIWQPRMTRQATTNLGYEADDEDEGDDTSESATEDEDNGDSGGDGSGIVA